MLTGGHGTNVLTGGAGLDLFVVGLGDDLITDFDVAAELLDLRGAGLSYADLGTITVGSSPAGLMLSFVSGARVTLQGVGPEAADRVMMRLSDGIATGFDADVITGTDAAETLSDTIGGIGKRVEAGAGDDMILGGLFAGDDTFIGGVGDDVITDWFGTYSESGGAEQFVDRDTYVFRTGDGADQYLDFNLFSDRIDVSGLDLSRADLTTITRTQTGDGALLDFGGGDTILLRGLSLIEIERSLLFLTTNGLNIGFSDGPTGDEVFTISGGPGQFIDGGDGVDTVDYSALPDGAEVVIFGGGLTSGQLTFDVQRGAGSYDTLLRIEKIIGSDNSDFLDGHMADLTLEGGGGDDAISGGEGNDTLTGGDGQDTFFCAPTRYGMQVSGHDVITDFTLGPDGDLIYYTFDGPLYTQTQFRADLSGDAHSLVWTISPVQTMTFTGLAFTNSADVDGLVSQLMNIVTGGPTDDTLNGTALRELIFGQDGDDNLFGSDNIDTLHGGDGDDYLDGGEGADTLYGEADEDYLDGDAGDDLLEGGTGRDRLIGGSGDDTFTGGAGADRFTVGADADVITDFDVDEDYLDLSWVLSNLDAVAALALSEEAAGLRIAHTGGLDLLLEGLDLSDAAYLRFGIGEAVLTGLPLAPVLEATAAAGGGFELTSGNTSDRAILLGQGDDTITISRFTSNTVIGGDGQDVITILNDEGPTHLGLADFSKTIVMDSGGQDTIVTGFNLFRDKLDVSQLFDSLTDFATNSGDYSYFSTATGAGVQFDGGANILFEDRTLDSVMRNLTFVLSDGETLGIDPTGDETFIGGQGGDVLDGGDGFDTVDFSGNLADGVRIFMTNVEYAASVGTQHLISIEHIIGTDFADEIDGTAADNLFEGGAGHDILDGRGGNDTLTGGSGEDWFAFRVNYSDAAWVGGGPGVLVGGITTITDFEIGVDRFALVGSQTMSETEFAASFDLTTPDITMSLPDGLTQVVMTGTANTAANRQALWDTVLQVANIVPGGDLYPLYGTARDDVITGSAFDDEINGGPGDDTLTGGDGADQFVFSDLYEPRGPGISLITDFDLTQDVLSLRGGFARRETEFDAALRATPEGLELALTDGVIVQFDGLIDDAATRTALWAATENQPRVIVGTAQGELLTGYDNADDRIVGLDGADHLRGLGGDDTLSGMAGNDTVEGGAGADVLGGAAGDNLLLGGTGDDVLNGRNERPLLVDVSVLNGELVNAVYGLSDDVFDGNTDLYIGHDTLTGGQGADLFILGMGQDVITDFDLAEDHFDFTGTEAEFRAGLTSVGGTLALAVGSAGHSGLTVFNGLIHDQATEDALWAREMSPYIRDFDDSFYW